MAKTPAQVILRWNLQRNVAVIPGSSNPRHIKENTDIFDFELSAADMQTISRLDRGIEEPWRCADILPLSVLAVYAVENLNIIQFDFVCF